jgi:N-formylglutamate deformylase
MVLLKTDMVGGPEHGFSVSGPDTPGVPVVVSIPHAATMLGPLGLPLHEDLDPRCDADLHVDTLYSGLVRGPFIVAEISRFVLDLNRSSDDFTKTAVPEHPVAGGTSARGFIWEATTHGQPTHTRPLTMREWEARRDIHKAYHEAIGAALSHVKAIFGYAILVDGHSMPSRGTAAHPDAGALRAEIVPGDRDGKSCAPELMARVCDEFSSAGYSVAPNQPSRGGYTTQFHGQPNRNIHAIQIELRRDLYMDEATFDIRPAGFARLQQTLDRVLRAIEGFRPKPGDATAT